LSPGLFHATIPTDYKAMADFDLGTLSRKILLIVAILSCLVIAEMILVSAEEPAASVQDSPQHAVLSASSAEPSL
jgi:hypothetical protein